MTARRDMTYKIVLQRDEDGRINACCPQLQGCHTWGDTAEEAMAHIREAIELYLEDVPEAEIPELTAHVEFREITL